MPRLMPFVAAAILVAGFGMSHPALAATAPTVSDACAAAGLTPGEEPYTYCLISVSQMLHPQPHVADVYEIQARQGCSAEGLRPESAAYATCVADLDQTLYDAGTRRAR